MTFERHRDKNGEISRKHGNTLIGTLRKTDSIASGAPSSLVIRSASPRNGGGASGRAAATQSPVSSWIAASAETSPARVVETVTAHARRAKGGSSPHSRIVAASHVRPGAWSSRKRAQRSGVAWVVCVTL